ncbi:alpha-L-fucosidase [Marinifilum fragile]|uniref:alpha-L-fucosidase n=1 Tax=Marinifilum fragile TaxID=570161 RepID=UPI002AA69ECB|nr:alpha-L-fucosidase [Marinifilum fragile]
MKKYLLVILTCLVVYGASAQNFPNKTYQSNYETIMNRTEWWRQARFGMFIHFGAYAVPASGEWFKSNKKLTTEEYQKYIDDFNPDLFDARKWAKLAKEAGMKYGVLTAKHHDGYCLFDSKLTDYKISTYMPERDLVREYLEAFRAEGLKVGLYYSVIDWHHKDYPNVGNHPQREDEEYGKQKFDWDNYLKYMHGQVEELVTNYGNIDIMWFDYSFGEYKGEKWKSRELIEMVRKHQPDIILNNRLVGDGGSSIFDAEYPLGDFNTPEQQIPEAPIKDQYGNLVPWETCLTLNNSWGYKATDSDWKSPQLVIHTLVNCVSKGGNLLLNVGPNAKGVIPEPSVKILQEVGKWMSKNGESIYACGIPELPKTDWGRYTQNGNKLYAHWMYPHLGGINIKGYAEKTKQVILLHDGSEAHTFTSWWGNQNKDNFFINVNAYPHFAYQLPDDIDTVFRLELKNVESDQ